MTDADRMAERVRRAREMAGLSLGQAARVLGCLRQTVADFEAGYSTPQPSHLQQMADVYRVSLAWLRGDDVKFPEATVRWLAQAPISDEDRDRLLELLTALDGQPVADAEEV
jgi:transcriptional regulator with XRE-family HTH domain